MKIVSIILARGGSKGIPGKNITKLKGLPLLSYTIRASQKSRAEETWVSTDCQKIKDISKLYDASVIDRPEEISGDFNKSEEALIHFASTVKFDILVFIQPTSPLVNENDLNKGISMVLDNKYDSVFSASKEHWTPRWTKDIKPINWDISNRPMRQEIEEQYVENGAFYVTKRDCLLESKNRYSGNTGIVEMPNYRSFQVDTLDDLQLIGKLL